MRAPAALLTLFALVVPACGGAAGEDPPAPAPGGRAQALPSSAGWSGRASAVCERYARLVAGLPRPATAERLPDHLEDIAALGRAERGDLRSLDPTAARREPARLLLAAFERRAIALERLAEAERLSDNRQAQVALRSLRRSNGAARRWADDAGIPACGQSLYGPAR